MAIQSSTIAWKIPRTEESWTLTLELKGFKGKNNHLWLGDPKEQIFYFYNIFLLLLIVVKTYKVYYLNHFDV